MKFELDKDERARLDAWEKRHLEEQHNGKWPYAGAIGGGISFVIAPTSLGTIVSVECSHCKVRLLGANDESDVKVYSECLTDFSDW